MQGSRAVPSPLSSDHRSQSHVRLRTKLRSMSALRECRGVLATRSLIAAIHHVIKEFGAQDWLSVHSTKPRSRRCWRENALGSRRHDFGIG